ncbi:MAG: filamentous hemagglutinin N-terminal domain-containing protein, partial [Pseudanabaenales cyanobacterium]|nr:filamentous hemagglutinin N-terminal domain-containing protein [Pseudanabaenales cyanobacterium]
MLPGRSPFGIGVAALLAIVTLPSSVQAQITPDNTLGDENSTVTPDAIVRGDLADLIEGGATRGGNLFHSFLEFNVDQGQRVYFANPVGIESILSRVTGDDLSNIFGTLGVDGSADLFLLNPNGIVFGENATLDIEGSFYATTAAAIELGDQVFSATEPERSRLLTVNPSVLFENYLSDASGDIENRGQIGVEENLTLAANRLDLQGQVAAGGNLTLLAIDEVQIRDAVDVPFIGFAGGDLRVQGNQQVDIVVLSHPDSGLYSYGNMTLRSANRVGGDAHYWSGGDFRIEGLEGEPGDLASLVDPIIRTLGDVVIGQYTGTSLHILAGGAVTIDFANITAPAPGTLGVDFLQEMVQLSDGALVEVNGAAQPTLDIRAGISPEVLGVPPLELLTGVDPTTDTFSGAVFETDSPSTADITIGDVVISAPGGLVLITNQYSPNSSLSGGNILVTGEGPLGDGINAEGGQGQGGTVFLDARGNIEVINSFISTEGSGEVGDVVLLAGNIVRLDGSDGSEAGAFSGVASGGEGRGGDVRVIATNLEVTNGAQLSASTFGIGDAGNVILRISETAQFDGVNQFTEINPSGAFSSVQPGGEGQGGNVEISARNLEVANGATLSASTFGRGDAGNVILTIRETARFDGVNPFGGISPSGAFSTVEPNGEGQGGNVELSAKNLEVTNGAQLSAVTFSRGDAGNVILTISETARFDGVNRFTEINPSGAFSSVAPNGEGQGGNIELSAKNLEVANGAQLQSATFGRGDAGNVILTIRETARFDGVNPFGGISASGAFS